MFRKLVLGAIAVLILPTAVQAATYRVNYRATPAAAWLRYDTTHNLAAARTQAASLRRDGYQAAVVAVRPRWVATGGTSTWTGSWGWHRNWHHAAHRVRRHHVAHHGAHRGRHHHAAHHHGHHGGHRR